MNYNDPFIIFLILRNKTYDFKANLYFYERWPLGSYVNISLRKLIHDIKRAFQSVIKINFRLPSITNSKLQTLSLKSLNVLIFKKEFEPKKNALKISY